MVKVKKTTNMPESRSGLGGLRAITGSVKASLAAHVTWNLVSALAMIAVTNLKL